MKKAMKKPMSKKADINKNKKIEPWEAARSRAIAKSMDKKKGGKGNYTPKGTYSSSYKEESIMPKVGTKTFPYTSAGHQQAQKHARSTGQKMMMKKGGKVKKGYRKGGLKKGK